MNGCRVSLITPVTMICVLLQLSDFIEGLSQVTYTDDGDIVCISVHDLLSHLRLELKFPACLLSFIALSLAV